ncbi:MAG: thioredoxin domain-containing protein [Hyphomicrobium sp.]
MRSGRRCATISAAASPAGVNGTPTFFINGRRHDGSFDPVDLIAAIDAQLADAS